MDDRVGQVDPGQFQLRLRGFHAGFQTLACHLGGGQRFLGDADLRLRLQHGRLRRLRPGTQLVAVAERHQLLRGEGFIALELGA